MNIVGRSPPAKSVRSEFLSQARLRLNVDSGSFEIYLIVKAVPLSLQDIFQL